MANQNVLQLTQQANTDYSSVFYAVTGGTTDTGLPLTVLFNNANLTGTPTIAGYLSNAVAASTYLSQANANTTYLSKATAASTYATIAQATTNVAITGGSINGVNIGGTSAAAANFTSVTVSALITPSTTVGIKGTTLADSAQAGSVGEYLVNSGTAVSLTSATTTNILTLNLSPGDWDVQGVVTINPASTTTVSTYFTGIATVNNTLGILGQYMQSTNAGAAASVGAAAVTPVVRLNVSTTTTAFLNVNVAFATSTCTATGFIRARRVR